MDFDLKINAKITTDEFSELLSASTLAERRPIHDRTCLEAMLKNASLLITAWDKDKLIGIARSITDFVYACYLSDLAIDVSYQHLGIGKKLVALTQQQLGPRCTLILLAAPNANSYYEHIGFAPHPRCWVLERNQNILTM